MRSIVIAENDADLRSNLCHFLFGEGFIPLAASNGIGAYKLSIKKNPSLILSDLNMPVSGGIHLLKKIRSNKTTKSIPLIFISTEGREDDTPRIYPGADGYLSKPFSLNVLLDLIIKVLDEHNKKNFPL